MSTVTTDRQIDLTGLAWPATQSWDGTEAIIAADVPEADLRAAVDAAPEHVDADPAAGRAAFRDAVSKPTTVGALRDAILGTSTGVKPEVRPGR